MTCTRDKYFQGALVNLYRQHILFKMSSDYIQNVVGIFTTSKDETNFQSNSLREEGKSPWPWVPNDQTLKAAQIQTKKQTPQMSQQKQKQSKSMYVQT